MKPQSRQMFIKFVYNPAHQTAALKNRYAGFQLFNILLFVSCLCTFLLQRIICYSRKIPFNFSAEKHFHILTQQNLYLTSEIFCENKTKHLQSFGDEGFLSTSIFLSKYTYLHYSNVYKWSKRNVNMKRHQKNKYNETLQLITACVCVCVQIIRYPFKRVQFKCLFLFCYVFQ